jgi:phospholipase C
VDERRVVGVERGRAISRRHFLRGAGAAMAAVSVGAVARGRARAQAGLPAPGASGIEHVVVVMMENRSFDHYLGWMDGVDGRQAGLRYPDRDGVLQRTHRLAPDYQGCAFSDPDHSFEGGRVEYDNGRCDGWLLAGDNDEYSIGYYTRKDLPFLGNAATHWTVCDQYFSAIMAETYPNRFYQHAAQTDRLTNTTDISTLPTIWDRLADKGLEGRYYFSDAPFLGLWGTKYLPIGRTLANFLADAATGDLPEVAFVDPRFVDASLGTSGDDHPHADIRNGEAFLNLIYGAVTQSPAWAGTVLVINYDEWGGFFDHVPPTSAPVSDQEKTLGNTDGLRGFRVPCVIVSPFAGRGAVSSTVFDHTSILKMIEWRWGLTALTVRDASANNLAEALDFSTPNLSVKQFDVPTGPFGAPCAGAAPDEKWSLLLAAAAALGWPVPVSL